MLGQISPCPAPVLKTRAHTSFSGGFFLFPSQRAMSFDTSLLEVINSTLEDILHPCHGPISAGSWLCCPGQKPFPSFGDKNPQCLLVWGTIG